MSMHIEGPYLTTTGKIKGKQKHRTSIHAARSRQNKESWEELQKKWGISDSKKSVKPVTKPKIEPYRRDTGPRIASKQDTIGVALKAPDKVYTGSAIVGIGQLHKSNAIPVFKAEDAVDIAKMRRG